ncbi:hypothetical protein EDB89DRAFT_1933443 [Lactarius sanguifluus]|nr:hypothetical protein EDB89DRAFT_1933443 [Lactarius sanguifluus]
MDAHEKVCSSNLHDEYHSILGSPKVEFCGYSAPHPSENHIQVRIQMYDSLSSLTALLGALDDLDALFESIEDAYNASLQHDDFEIWDEKR